MIPLQWPMSQGQEKANVTVQRLLGRNNSLSWGRFRLFLLLEPSIKRAICFTPFTNLAVHFIQQVLMIPPQIVFVQIIRHPMIQ